MAATPPSFSSLAPPAPLSSANCRFSTNFSYTVLREKEIKSSEVERRQREKGKALFTFRSERTSTRERWRWKPEKEEVTHTLKVITTKQLKLRPRREVRIDADIKDGGMTLVTALSPHANWLHGNANLKLEVRGTVDQPILNGHASFHRASISSPVLRKPLTNFGGNVYVQSNRLCITSLESRVSRKGKLLVKANLPLSASEAALDYKIELKNIQLIYLSDKWALDQLFYKHNFSRVIILEGEENLGPWKNKVAQVAPEPGPEAKGTLVLAANRTNRPDILRRFRCYQGGWDIENRHYWAVRTTMLHFHRVFK
ncbi:hypothetical protein LR48_Vigan07g183400 [Vigna angularis]|uniref:Uncharacterized protein n=1 Tax=Phaseolus angularis TaxID=3914 RepID=A0A0L9UZ42_PHAAN|nr:hypothetical protein LR48_Vigan07g183400 [Vigna angularis]